MSKFSRLGQHNPCRFFPAYFSGHFHECGTAKISLPQYGIDIPIPSLSYGEDATPQGLIIAERFAAPGLQQAAALAVGGYR